MYVYMYIYIYIYIYIHVYTQYIKIAGFLNLARILTNSQDSD